MSSSSKKMILLSSRPQWTQWIQERARSVGIDVLAAGTADEAVQTIENHRVALCVLVIGSESTPWEEQLLRCRRTRDDLSFVVASDKAEASVILTAFRKGAVDFMLLSQGDAHEAEQVLVRALDRAAHRQELQESVGELQSTVEDFLSQLAVSGLSRSEGPKGPQRVLIAARPDEMAAQSVHALLDAGFAVQTAATTQETKRLCSAESFDVVVIEQNLPGGTGLTLMRDLGQKYPDSEFVFVVGFTGADSAVEALRWGAGAFMIKPYPAHELVVQVTELASRSSAKVQARQFVDDFRERYAGLWARYQEALDRIEDLSARTH
ncbi:MAG: response regulator [Deltaproteobacteria bacterium]|nr:response regulator [Deltaproteobacteria bacterium]